MDIEWILNELPPKLVSAELYQLLSMCLTAIGQEDFWKNGSVQAYGHVISPVAPPCIKGANGYGGAMKVTSCLLEMKFGKKLRLYSDHSPVMSFRPAIEEMNAIWLERFLSTASHRIQHPTDIMVEVMSPMYLEATNRATFQGSAKKGVFGAIHTNGGGYCPRPCDGLTKDISPDRLKKVEKWLSDAPKKYRWANIQGPGFDYSYMYRW